MVISAHYLYFVVVRMSLTPLLNSSWSGRCSRQRSRSGLGRSRGGSGRRRRRGRSRKRSRKWRMTCPCRSWLVLVLPPRALQRAPRGGRKRRGRSSPSFVVFLLVALAGHPPLQVHFMGSASFQRHPCVSVRATVS